LLLHASGRCKQASSGVVSHIVVIGVFREAMPRS